MEDAQTWHIIKGETDSPHKDKNGTVKASPLKVQGYGL